VCPPTTAWTRRCGALPQCGAEFLIGELDIDTAGYNSLPNDVWEDPDEWLEDGDIVRLESRELRVMHTRGTPSAT
jgi:glyoxylase-like metal-dependent hydrolase (beta-lactamase superfamily II)